MKPAVKSAIEEMVPMLHEMTTDTIGDTYNRIAAIRNTLDDEQDELEVLATLITIGEL